MGLRFYEFRDSGINGCFDGCYEVEGIRLWGKVGRDEDCGYGGYGRYYVICVIGGFRDWFFSG